MNTCIENKCTLLKDKELMCIVGNFLPYRRVKEMWKNSVVLQPGKKKEQCRFTFQGGGGDGGGGWQWSEVGAEGKVCVHLLLFKQD